MDWNKIIGHDENKQQLQAMLVGGNVFHALLFSGPDGLGKKTTAVLTAAALLCQRQDGQICGVCPSCRRMEQESHPDYMLVQPDGATIKIEQIRALQHEAALAAYLGMYRIFLIENAELMTTPAANSLLKTLEEPPPNIVFILLTSRQHMLLPTIVSRCRLFRFSPLPWGTLADILEKRGASPEKALVAARLSGGRLGAAWGFLESEGLAWRDRAAEILFSLPVMGMRGVWDYAASLEKAGRADILQLLRYMLFLLRDLLVLSATGKEELVYNIDMMEKLTEQSAVWRPDGLAGALKTVKTANQAVQANANLRLTIEALLINLLDCSVE